MDMELSNLIGSVLFFKPDGLDERGLIKIREFSIKRNLNLIRQSDISEVYFLLNEYEECFIFEKNRIFFTRKYGYDEDRLKRRFFDVLAEDDRDIIYSLLDVL